MVEYTFRELFDTASIHKNLIITGDDFTIENEDIFEESLRLHESINSEDELIFGSCEASCFKITINNNLLPLTGKKIKVEMVLDGHTEAPFEIGHYEVYSDIPTADTNKRELTCYDALYTINNSNVAGWYNSLMFPILMKDFRRLFIEHFGIVEDTYSLANDDLLIQRTIEAEEISGAEVIQRICELNGCFGHIGRNGHFQYITLEEPSTGLYPSNTLYPAEDLYPKNLRAELQNYTGKYLRCKYEQYTTQKIDKLQIRENEEDIGAIVGTGTNAYIIEDNFLVYGKSAAELNGIALNLFDVIRKVEYTPFDMEAVSNLCIECGDIIHLATSEKIINSYMLERETRGIQSLFEKVYAYGYESRMEDLYSTNHEIIQLKKKTNELVRNVDVTRQTLTDFENYSKSQFEQTAEEISAKVSNIGGTRAFSWSLTESAFSLKSNNNEVFKANSSGIEVKGKITAESGYIGTASQGFNIGSSSIYNGISSLNATSGNGIYIGTDGINLGGGNFKITSEGQLISKKGTIGGFTIDSNAIYNGPTTYYSDKSGVYIGADGINLGGKFRVSKDGVTNISSYGSLAFTNVSGSKYGEVTLNSDGLTFSYNSSRATSISRSEIKIKNVTLKSDEIEVVDGYNSRRYTNITAANIKFGSTGGYISVIDNKGGIGLGTNDTITLNGAITLSGTMGGTTYKKITICSSYSETLAFFGATGQKRQTWPSNGTLTNLVNILKGYGLLG